MREEVTYFHLSLLLHFLDEICLPNSSSLQGPLYSWHLIGSLCIPKRDLHTVGKVKYNGVMCAYCYMSIYF